MNARTVLLFGCNGQLGFELQKTLPALGRLVACDFPETDFAKPDSLRPLVQEVRPNIIVNAAAYTGVDRAEREMDKAHAINAIAPMVIAEEAESLDAIFVHYSTDYVFDGKKIGFYVETDTTHPLSVYGLTKRDGEQAVAFCRRHLVFRTSWVVGAHGKNFVKTMLGLASEHDSLRVVADQIGAPTSAKLLAEVTANILMQMIDATADDRRWGLYHLTGGGATSWNGLARRVISRAAAAGLPLKVTPEKVTEIATVDYPTPAKRPANSRLDTGKLRTTFEISIPDWTDGMDEVLDRIITEMRS